MCVCICVCIKWWGVYCANTPSEVFQVTRRVEFDFQICLSHRNSWFPFNPHCGGRGEAALSYLQWRENCGEVNLLLNPHNVIMLTPLIIIIIIITIIIITSSSSSSTVFHSIHHNFRITHRLVPVTLSSAAVVSSSSWQCWMVTALLLLAWSSNTQQRSSWTSAVTSPKTPSLRLNLMVSDAPVICTGPLDTSLFIQTMLFPSVLTSVLIFPLCWLTGAPLHWHIIKTNHRCAHWAIWDTWVVWMVLFPSHPLH